jgi:hypothetical protein
LVGVNYDGESGDVVWELHSRVNWPIRNWENQSAAENNGSDWPPWKNWITQHVFASNNRLFERE